MKHPLSIAVTSVGSGIGQSIVQSCRFSRLPLKLIGLDMNATAYGAFECDRQRRIPPIADPGYVPDLVGICREERVDLLIPGLDSELPLLAESRGLFEEIGTRVLVADSAFIGLCRDKVRWSRELGPLSAAVLPCFEYGEIVPLLDSGIVDFPLIAKPRDGSASAGVVILNDRRQLAGLDPELLLQPFVFPEETDPHFPDLRTAVAGNRLRQEAEISVQWIVSKDQRLLGRMASYNRLKNGVPVEIVPIEDGRVWAALDEIFPYLCGKGMRGPVNFQGRMTEDGPRFFEMNARFTGITGLRAMLGFNEVDSLVRDFLDLAPSIAPVTHNRGRVGMRQVADRIVSPRHFPTLAKRAGDIPGYAGHGNREAVLVTGATGWLGRHLARRLALDGGYDVFALVRDRSRALAVLGDPEATGIAIVTTEEYLRGSWSLGRIDTIVHCAAGRPPDGAAAIAAGLALTQRLVTDAVLFQVPKFIHVSSQAVYGLSSPPLWHESLEPAPETPYATAKAASESMTGSIRRLNRTSFATSLRLARLYGAAEGMRWSELPHRFALQALAGEEIVINGGGQRFDLLHIEDAVAAIQKVVASSPAGWKPTYNLGSGGSMGIVEIAEAAVAEARAFGRSGTRITRAPAENSQRFGMNIDRFRSDFSWEPARTLPDAMREIAARAHAGGDVPRAGGPGQPPTSSAS